MTVSWSSFSGDVSGWNAGAINSSGSVTSDHSSYVGERALGTLLAPPDFGNGGAIFAVGDVKQSIYSFQGADPHLFMDMRSIFAERLAAIEKRLQPVALDVSFRSTTTTSNVWSVIW